MQTPGTRPRLKVLAPGPMTTVQDLGRPGQAALGVGPSGAADVPSLCLANRLLGNDEGCAALEVYFGGLSLLALEDVTVSVTGALCGVVVAGRAEAANTVLHVPAGAQIRVERPRAGMVNYVAVRGGIAVDAVLGSRSTDTLAELGPERPVEGTVLPVGPPPARLPTVDAAPGPVHGSGTVHLRAVLGPRHDWFDSAAHARLFEEPFTVTSKTNRVGARLEGPALRPVRTEELPSEGTVRGSLQVPRDGSPVLFGADHPLTGGYPVIAVVLSTDLPKAAQAVPGTVLRFRPHRRGDPAAD